MKKTILNKYKNLQQQTIKHKPCGQPVSWLKALGLVWDIFFTTATKTLGK